MPSSVVTVRSQFPFFLFSLLVGFCVFGFCVVFVFLMFSPGACTIASRPTAEGPIDWPDAVLPTGHGPLASVPGVA